MTNRKVGNFTPNNFLSISESQHRMAAVPILKHLQGAICSLNIEQGFYLTRTDLYLV